MSAPNCTFIVRPDEWKVYFAGRVQSPTFNSKGAAEVFLHGLISGFRKPEVSQ